MKNKSYTSIWLLILLAFVAFSLVGSCKRDRDENPPLIVTDEVTKIGSTTAFSGGTITLDDGFTITTRGTCWSTTLNPSVKDHKTVDGTGTGEFESVLTGLLPNTFYYTRTYAIRGGSVIYGNLVSFKTEDVVTDIDGNIYNTITIGDQVWMVENLRTTRFLNGDAIGTTTTSTLEIIFEPDPIYQWAYDGREKNASKFGRLYTWYAAMDLRGLCPAGWHIPSDAEWTAMENYLVANEYNYDGTTTGNKIANSLASITEWRYTDEKGTAGNTDDTAFRNNSGFTALPGGYRNSEGRFVNIGISGCWWSSSEWQTYNAFYRYLYAFRNDLNRSSYFEFGGLSVRCIRD